MKKSQKSKVTQTVLEVQSWPSSFTPGSVFTKHTRLGAFGPALLLRAHKKGLVTLKFV